MCLPSMFPPFGYMRVKRSYVRHERLNRFATDRMLSAKSPAAVRFWQNVIRRTIGEYDSLEMAPWYQDALRQYARSLREPPQS